MVKKTFDAILLLVMIGVICGVGFCRESVGGKSVGGKHKVPRNGAEIESIGRFAVQRHNEDQNTLLKFVRVVEADEQVVEGTMYYLTLEATDGSKKNLYKAKVWVKPWMNFKQLQQFSLVKK